MIEEVNTGNKRARKQTDRIVAASAALLAPAPKKARSTTSTSNTAKAQAQAQQQYVSIVPQFETKVLPSVALSQFDKASQLVLSHDQLICLGCEVITSHYLTLIVRAFPYLRLTILS